MEYGSRGQKCLPFFLRAFPNDFRFAKKRNLFLCNAFFFLRMFMVILHCWGFRKLKFLIVFRCSQWCYQKCMLQAFLRLHYSFKFLQNFARSEQLSPASVYLKSNFSTVPSSLPLPSRRLPFEGLAKVQIHTQKNRSTPAATFTLFPPLSSSITPSPI